MRILSIWGPAGTHVVSGDTPFVGAGSARTVGIPWKLMPGTPVRDRSESMSTKIAVSRKGEVAFIFLGARLGLSGLKDYPHRPLLCQSTDILCYPEASPSCQTSIPIQVNS